MSTLADQIAAVDAAADGDQYSREEMRQAAKTMRFLQKYEPEIRAAIPAWRLAREDPTVKALVDAFPNSSLSVRDTNVRK